MTTPTKKSDGSQAHDPDSAEAPAKANVPITLDQLARDLTIPPRDARMLLRLAAKQPKQYPNLGKEHVARQPWSWAPGSQALEEARKALLSSRDD